MRYEPARAGVTGERPCRLGRTDLMTRQSAIRVNDHYRITFRWEQGDATRSKSRTTTTTGRPITVRAVPPGNILLHDVLEPLELTQSAAAERLGVPVQTVNQIVRGRRAISPEMALRLERAFEVSAEFWVRG